MRVGLFAVLIPAVIYAVTTAEFVRPPLSVPALNFPFMWQRQTDATYGADKDKNTRGATKDYI